MSASPIVHRNATFTTLEALNRYERVYALGSDVRRASSTEVETGVVSRYTATGLPAAVEIAVAGNKITFLADTAITQGNDVFRAAGGRVSSVGTSRIGRALHNVDAGGPIQCIYEPGGSGGSVTINGAILAGDYDPTTNTPALTDASGVDQTSYKVTPPAAQQVRDFGSGNITFPADTGGELRHTGGQWRFYPHTIPSVAGTSDPELILGTTDPVGAPPTGAKRYVRTDTGETWNAVGAAWVQDTRRDFITIAPADPTIDAQVIAAIRLQAAGDARAMHIGSGTASDPDYVWSIDEDDNLVREKEPVSAGGDHFTSSAAKAGRLSTTTLGHIAYVTGSQVPYWWNGSQYQPVYTVPPMDSSTRIAIPDIDNEEGRSVLDTDERVVMYWTSADGWEALHEPI